MRRLGWLSSSKGAWFPSRLRCPAYLTLAQTRKKVNYVESDGEDVLRQVDGNRRSSHRSLKRRKLSVESEDEFALDDSTEDAMMEIGRLNFNKKDLLERL